MTNFLFLILLFHSFSFWTASSSPDDDFDKIRGGSTSQTKSPSPPEEESPQRTITVSIPEHGKLKGRREGGVDMWKGIPYAAPPVGALRFSPPEPVQPWYPTRLEAFKYAPDCWQITNPLSNPVNHEMSEDCLYLNVFTPAGHAERTRPTKLQKRPKLLPVMIWFHGGAFQQGGGNRDEYDGRRLAERDIVVVTFNYRLGALGFLVSSEDGLYGNFGLMDQRAAIEFIHTHIRYFGGDPDNITLFGESAGAVTIGLHLLMSGAGTLFHRVILQSNPLGYTFRNIIVADFIGEALKRELDCRDLTCLRTERVEEIIRAQGSLMGVPRSVGDFFTWGPTLTKETKLKLSLMDGKFLNKFQEHRLPRLDASSSLSHSDTSKKKNVISEWKYGGDRGDDSTPSKRWSAVNVTQPLSSIHLIPDSIPIIIGTNKHEGEIFVHTAFPAPMPKPVYWMFVGALFRDSANKVLRHYRALVEEVEYEANALAKKQIEEEEAKQDYLEHHEELENEYEMLLNMNATRRRMERDRDSLRALVKSWSISGGASVPITPNPSFHLHNQSSYSVFLSKINSFLNQQQTNRAQRIASITKMRTERRIAKQKAKALREAAKVVVDYRPVMSRIIDDYLFRCPSWHMAQLLSEQRKTNKAKNVFVYRFSQPTHIPGYKECWGKSCHTAEMPYVFQSMDVLRSNYSTLGPHAQNEAPSAPEYPYTEIMAAFRGALEDQEHDDNTNDNEKENNLNKQQPKTTKTNDPKKSTSTHNIKSSYHNQTTTTHHHHPHHDAFQRILKHFFGDYFTEDADFELASDMADRWAAFATTGNPNYEGSQSEWLSWFHNRNEGEQREERYPNRHDLYPDQHYQQQQQQRRITYGNEEEKEYGDFWDDFTEDDFFFSSSDEEFEDDEDLNEEQIHRLQQKYRQKALSAMEMETIEHDKFHTILRRVPSDSKDYEGIRHSFFSSWSSSTTASSSTKEEDKKKWIHKFHEVLRIAQEMGIMGTGLQHGTYFPELMELSWPPEGRLIERDCTCDMWDKIRYRY